jgi:hypothetical protein
MILRWRREDAVTRGGWPEVSMADSILALREYRERTGMPPSSQNLTLSVAGARMFRKEVAELAKPDMFDPLVPQFGGVAPDCIAVKFFGAYLNLPCW